MGREGLYVWMPRGRTWFRFSAGIATAATVVLLVVVFVFEGSAEKQFLGPANPSVIAKKEPVMKKKIHLENSGPPLTCEDITAFEREIGGRLPDDYKEFMLAHNGGQTHLGLPWDGGISRIFGFDTLFPAGQDSGIRGGLRYLRELNAAKVDGYLPIAGTFSGGYICLSCRGSKFGAVYFTALKYKIAYIDDLVPIDLTMVPLADSFTKLLDYLVEIPNPYCRIEDLGKKGTADDLAKYLSEGHSIDALSKNRLTLLCEAIKFDNTAMIQSCIERGASLSGSIERAVGNRRIHLIEMLIKAGANINERDELGNTPLHYAGGWGLPGEEGAQNRKLRDLLFKLGAVQ